MYANKRIRKDDEFLLISKLSVLGRGWKLRGVIFLDNGVNYDD